MIRDTSAQDTLLAPRSQHKTKWALIAGAVLLGFVWLAAGIAADDPRGGLIAMAIMFLYAAVLAVAGSRAEPFRLLRGDPRTSARRAS